jgi:hypothetical protein
MRTRKLHLPLILCSLAALAGCKSSTDGSSVKTDPFTSGALGAYTIYNTPQAWSIVDGHLAAGTAARQSVVIRKGATLADGWVETQTDHAVDGGLVLRFQSGGNYYLLAIRDDSWFGYANLEIYRVVGGEFTRIGGPADVSFTGVEPGTFRFEAAGTTLTAYMNGLAVLQVSDAAYRSGGFGLRHDNTREWPEITSRFDLLRWSAK